MSDEPVSIPFVVTRGLEAKERMLRRILKRSERRYRRPYFWYPVACLMLGAVLNRFGAPAWTPLALMAVIIPAHEALRWCYRRDYLNEWRALSRSLDPHTTGGAATEAGIESRWPHMETKFAWSWYTGWRMEPDGLVLSSPRGEEPWVSESFGEGDWPRFLELVARKVPKAGTDA